MATVDVIRCANIRCSNDSRGGGVATVEWDGGVLISLCQPCLRASGLGIQTPAPRPRPDPRPDPGAVER